ncbi:Ig-like domain-containing protein [Hymenobacter canadensis]|uniref:Ig-like domain-containing protein n=1 Tax=Hymenobacter canadensis TaxID=2999067 RepID=A0ABY7LRP4_9BACT|nr:Ig-like domain-containing protein [Hymenobacter canadensis]WBA43084.1 Ig-like domain-containing protein [Hymenobacter canadensis]
MPLFVLLRLSAALTGLATGGMLLFSLPPAASRPAARPATTAPVALDDHLTRSYTAATDLDILGNDQAGNAALNPASVVLLGPVTSGTTDVAGTGGTFSVAPTGLLSARVPAFNGASTVASIRYTVQDQAGETSAPATLHLTLTNAPPQAQPDAATTATNTPVMLAVASNDSDADGPTTLRPATVVLTSEAGTNGGGSFHADGNGTVTFTPAGGFSGTSSTSYTIRDEQGLASAPALLTVTVSNATPVAVRDVAATLAGTPVQVAVLLNDSDDNGYGTLVPGSVVLSPGNGLTSGGQFSVDAATGVVTFVPAIGSTGATIGYRVRDTQGALSNSANLTVSITTVSADVQATLRGPATTPAGGFAEYTLTLNNQGSVAATGVQGRVRLPAYLSQVTASHNAVYLASTGAVAFPAADLPAAGTRVHTVRFLMPARASVAALGFSTASAADLVIENNNGSQANAAASTAPTQVADVVAVGTGPATASASGSVSYQLMAVNYGPSVATDVSLGAQLPANLSGVTVSGGGSYDAGSGRVTLPPVPALAARAGLSCQVSFDVPPASTTLAGQVWATSGTADGDPAPANNDGSSPLAALRTTFSGPVASTYCAGPATLDATTTGGQLLNAYYPGLGTTTGTNVSVGPALSPVEAAPIQAGDLVLVMQMQGADLDYANTAAYGDGAAHDDIPANGNLLTNFSAGLYEYRYVTLSNVTPTGGGTLVLASALTNTYTNAEATNSTGARRYQVLRVPRFRHLTLGADLRPAPWNGRTGGVLALQAEGALDLAGYRLDARGCGFRGGGSYLQGGPGPASTSTTDWAMGWGNAVHASKGEGLAGSPRLVNQGGVLLNTGAEGYPGGSMGRGAPGNAGGGGTDGSVLTNQNNTGGGGGSNGGFGGQGGNAWFLGNATGGSGGAPFLAAHPGRVVLGGGGGAGSSNNGTGGLGQAITVNNGFNSSGGAGGGIVLLSAGQVTGPGTIDVSGTSVTLPVDNDGGGGGGGSGSVVVLSSSSLAGLTVVANGGRGGDDNLTVTAPHGPGGGGSAGVVFASGPLNAASQALPGSNGLTGSTNGPGAFGATPGTQLPFQWRTNLVPAEVPLPAECQLVPLPVSLIRFDAAANGAAVELTWATAQEVNSARFEVERSPDGRRFARVGRRAAAGHSTSPRTYAFTDLPAAAAANGLLYYRLRLLDLDSSATLTPVRVVQFRPTTQAQPTVFPNPTSAGTTLDLTTLPAATYSVALFNLLGQRLQQYEPATNQRVQLNTRPLPPGIYLLQISAPGYRWCQKLIRQ